MGPHRGGERHGPGRERRLSCCLSIPQALDDRSRFPPIAYLPSAFPRPRLSPPRGVWVGTLKKLHQKPHASPPFCRKGKCDDAGYHAHPTAASLFVPPLPSLGEGRHPIRALSRWSLMHRDSRSPEGHTPRSFRIFGFSQGTDCDDERISVSAKSSQRSNLLSSVGTIMEPEHGRGIRGKGTSSRAASA
jgi:hypothetical protein